MGQRLLLANTKHLHDICAMLDQQRRRWADVVQMLCKGFVFAGLLALVCWVGTNSTLSEIRDVPVCRVKIESYCWPKR